MSLTLIDTESGDPVVPVSSGQFGQVAWNELQAANEAFDSLDLSKGFRLAIPTALEVGRHYANSYVAAILALWSGTKTEP